MLRWLATFLILAAGLFVLLLALGSHLQLDQARELVAQGRQAEATVTEAYTVPRGSASGYSYVYAVGNANYSASKRSIPRSERERVPAGTKIPVFYDAANPERATTRAEIADMEAFGNRVIFPLTGLLLIAWAIARMVRRRRPVGTSSRTQLRKSAAMPNKNARVIIPFGLVFWLLAVFLITTDAPKAIIVAYGVCFAVAVPLIVFYLMAETGWSTLAKRFRQGAPFNGAWQRCPTGYMALVSMDDPDYQSSKMGFISTLRVGTTAEALYLSMLFSKIPILGLFFPNVRIPWSTVRKARAFDAPGFFKKGDVVLVQVNYDPNYAGTFIELEIGEPPVFLQLPASVLGDAIERLPFAARA